MTGFASKGPTGGALRQVIEDALDADGLTLADLTVLSPQRDPFRLDTRSGHINGEWFAEHLAEVSGGRPRHLRGIHYAFSMLPGLKRPNGRRYRNDHRDWQWLGDTAAKAARWLSKVPFEAIVDERNEPATIFRGSTFSTGPTIAGSLVAWLSISGAPPVFDLHASEPHPTCHVVVPQPYHLIVFAEKTSILDILRPIAARFGADIYPAAGEISDTRIDEMAIDGAKDGRPMRVFAVTDFDPAGFQMAISIARKLQAFKAMLFPDLQFEVRRIGLTAEQVQEYDLPSTPLKPTELRASAWRKRFGVEQTEVDALAALRPQVLADIIRQALQPFHDDTLGKRIAAAERDWTLAARKSLKSKTDSALFERLKAEAEQMVADLQQHSDDVHARIEELGERLQSSLPTVKLPAAKAPVPQLDPALYGKPLISTDWSWTEQTTALIQHKRYIEEGGE
jgi:hypothetical protein